MIIFETERLRIRHLAEEDAEFILELLNEPSFIQNIGDRNVRTAEDARGYIRNIIKSYEKNGFGLSCVILKETGESTGMCGLIKRDALEDVDVGYAFLPRFWSKGYAIESVREMLKYGKDKFGLNRIVAIVDPKNQGSIRVLEKAGLEYEKMIRITDDDIDLKLLAIQF